MNEIVVEEEHHGVPIQIKWVDRGYTPNGHLGANWCGYVQTELDDVDRLDLNEIIGVHGGLTYGPGSTGWIGFDCAHSRDVCVRDHHPEPEIEDWHTVWTLEDVLAETRRLAEQIAVIEEEPSTETREVAELYAEEFGGNEQTEEWLREKLRDLGLDFEVEVEEHDQSRTSAGESDDE